MTTIKKTETHNRLSMTVTFHFGGTFKLAFNRNSHSITVGFAKSMEEAKQAAETINKYVSNLKGTYGEQLKHMICVCEQLASGQELINYLAIENEDGIGSISRQ